MTNSLQTTPRREAHEQYLRYLLNAAGISPESADVYLNTKQISFDNKSLLDMVYSGEYDTATSVVESFVDGVDEKEVLLDESNTSTSSAAIGSEADE